jgi:hypothetical protein
MSNDSEVNSFIRNLERIFLLKVPGRPAMHDEDHNTRQGYGFWMYHSVRVCLNTHQNDGYTIGLVVDLNFVFALLCFDNYHLGASIFIF